MPSSQRHHPEPGESGSSQSLTWTLAMGAALLALSLAPRSRRRPQDESEPAPRRDEGARSHSGRSAEWVAATQAHRGRTAGSPTEITRAGWKDIAVRVYLEFNKDRVLAVAAGVTFFTLLSLFPAIAALVSCYGLVADVGAINEHLSSMQGVLPSSAIDIIGEQVKRIAAKDNGTLGLTFFSSLVLSLWSANAAMKAMFDALNVVYEEEEKRSFVMLNLRSLTFTVGALLFTILALTSIVVLPVIFNFFGFGQGARLIALLRWPFLLVVLLGGLSLLYRYGPSRERPRWRWVGTGGAVAGLLWLAASILFSWYVGSFGNYNETYGSLGAAIGFMTWIWISTTIVLLGAEINAEMEHQTARDTTTGPEKPMGERQARMADTIGAAA
ncbi:YihY/virulence factor BrkB family protein [Methylobacterium sp. E-045]|uniref:YihY/virulence factor BrkB family protein n=1 Tax=Methylobacterium sp. E-045 TaxID=2836575 RepID=UPI001FBBC224|nr:YihY/virulence factor BrkB family protein [Methylobacterium sp. E-045]MCJ2130040.1 YihY/virulence factor BrkB family protein [Methylobacterium sp. E-045]